jgi:hypothetical protein
MRRFSPTAGVGFSPISYFSGILKLLTWLLQRESSGVFGEQPTSCVEMHKLLLLATQNPQDTVNIIYD